MGCVERLGDQKCGGSWRYIYRLENGSWTLVALKIDGFMMKDQTETPEFIAARNAAIAKYTGWIGHDALDPTNPSGHAYGIGVSTRLTSYYRQRRIMKANYQVIDKKILSQLADQVWEEGGQDILKFMQLAIENKAFPV